VSKKRAAAAEPEDDARHDSDSDGDGDGDHGDHGGDGEHGGSADGDGDQDYFNGIKSRLRKARMPVFEDKPGAEFPEVKGKRVPKAVIAHAEERATLAVDTMKFFLYSKDLDKVATYVLLRMKGMQKAPNYKELYRRVLQELVSMDKKMKKDDGYSLTDEDSKFVRDTIFKCTIIEKLGAEGPAATTSADAVRGRETTGVRIKAESTTVFGHVTMPRRSKRVRAAVFA
jgi:hypothetical protein